MPSLNPDWIVLSSQTFSWLLFLGPFASVTTFPPVPRGFLSSHRDLGEGVR